MKKQAFLDAIRELLAEHGLEQADIEARVARLSESISGEEIQAQALLQISDILAAQQESDAEEDENALSVPENSMESSSLLHTVFRKEDEPLDSGADDTTAEGAHTDAATRPEVNAAEADTAERAYHPVSSDGQAAHAAPTAQKRDDSIWIYPPYFGLSQGACTALVVVLFPFAVLLTAVAAVLMVSGYAVLGLLTGGLVLLMAAVVASGVGLALVGIIYGIIELFSNIPAGLYEIGLGLIFIGAAWLLGLGLYRLAMRCMPLLFRKLTHFVRYCIAQLKKLIRSVRAARKGGMAK